MKINIINSITSYNIFRAVETCSSNIVNTYSNRWKNTFFFYSDFKIEAFIKDLENPDDMVKEILEFQGIRTNKELREEYKKRKDKNKS